MSLALQVAPLPLHEDSRGTVRVGGTRVTLDTVVEAFLEGLTAEEIAQQYPVLELADIYAAISHYLRNRESIDIYLEQRRKTAASWKAVFTQRAPEVGFRERLLARRATRPL